MQQDASEESYGGDYAQDDLGDPIHRQVAVAERETKELGSGAGTEKSEEEDEDRKDQEEGYVDEDWNSQNPSYSERGAHHLIMIGKSKYGFPRKLMA